jgi:CRISPR system Cascade subunit CasA
MPGFNLADRGWIPCVMPDGACKEKGLKETLVRAHEIREVFDPSPLVTVALHRLLLAVLLRCYGPAKLADWKVLWRNGRWDAPGLEGYFRDWGGRFDLLDSQRPFYQQAGFAAKKETPIKRLAFEFAAQNNATLFDHSHDEERGAVPFGTAARWLVATQAFFPSAGKSETIHSKDSPCSRGATLLLQGDNLFETLCLNLLNVFMGDFPEVGRDAPAWESEAKRAPEHGVIPAGMMDYLTLESRWVRLLPRDDGVAGCFLAQGRGIREDLRSEPFFAYKRNEEGLFAWMLNEHRAMWRDSHALLHLADGAPFQLPRALNRVAQLVRDGVLDQRRCLQLHAIGQRLESGQPTIHFWRHERLPLPLAFLNDAALLGALRAALEIAEEVGKEVGGSAWRLARLLLFPNKPENEPLSTAQKAEAQKLADHLAPGRLYWAALEVPFRDMLLRLPADRIEREGAVAYGTRLLPEWAGRTRQAGLDAFEETTRSLDRSARTLRGVAKAEARLKSSINRIVKESMDKVKGGDA